MEFEMKRVFAALCIVALTACGGMAPSRQGADSSAVSPTGKDMTYRGGSF
jgi:hypothetical protein